MECMPSSMVGFSLITELICLRSEDLDYVAHFFGKHGVELCKKFYLQFFQIGNMSILERCECKDIANSKLSDKLPI